MLLIREIFIAKPGHAGELAKMMKAEMTEADDSGQLPKVYLDMVTDYNTIVVEYFTESLTAWEKSWEKEKEKSSKNTSTEKSNGPKYTDLYLTGRREILRLVE